MQLCKICAQANGGRFDEGPCHICRGGALALDGMIDEAEASMKGREYASFSISTKIPKDWLIREEDAWDRHLGDRTQSIKSGINRAISSALSKRLSLEYMPDGDCRAIFDLSCGKVSIEHNALFVFGRYMKKAAGLSQSRWLCSKCQGKGCKSCSGKGKLYESVEERIGEPLKEAAQARDYTMHASGREDVDATNSAGRAFVMEIHEARVRRPDLSAIAKRIAASGEVSVRDLSIVGRPFCEVVTESHFDKEYQAQVELERDLRPEDGERIASLEGRTILQQTPARVAHRRADLVRHRKVKRIEVVSSETGDPRQMTLKIRAEAGTYIKELISGDSGRTKPSVADLLGAGALCKALEVTWIDDGYLDLCLSSASGPQTGGEGRAP